MDFASEADWRDGQPSDVSFGQAPPDVEATRGKNESYSMWSLRAH